MVYGKILHSTYVHLHAQQMLDLQARTLQTQNNHAGSL